MDIVYASRNFDVTISEVEDDPFEARFNFKDLGRIIIKAYEYGLEVKAMLGDEGKEVFLGAIDLFHADEDDPQAMFVVDDPNEGDPIACSRHFTDRTEVEIDVWSEIEEEREPGRAIFTMRLLPDEE